MTSFVHVEQPSQHPGVARAEQVAASFASAAHNVALRIGAAFRNWNEARRAAAEDQKMWEVALTDARVMAELGRSMNLSARAQRLMRSYY